MDVKEKQESTHAVHIWKEFHVESQLCLKYLSHVFMCHTCNDQFTVHENLHTLRVLCRVLNEVRFNVCQGFEVSVRPAAEVVEFAFSRNNTF